MLRSGALHPAARSVTAPPVAEEKQLGSKAACVRLDARARCFEGPRAARLPGPFGGGSPSSLLSLAVCPDN